MVVGGSCLEHLSSVNSTWRSLSTVQVLQPSEDQWRFPASRCLHESKFHIFYTLRFYPALYFGLAECHSDDSIFCRARQAVLDQCGVLRQQTTMQGGQVLRELPDTAWFGLCVPGSCHMSSASDVIEVALPAWFTAGVDALPPAGCCFRLLSRYWLSFSNTVICEEFELRDRFYKAFDMNAMLRSKDFDCVDAFVSEEHVLGQWFGGPLQAKLLREHGSNRLWQIVEEPDWENMASLTLKDFAACVGTGHRYVSVQLGDLQEDDTVLLSEQWGMCVPQVCDDAALFHSVVPAVVGRNSYILVEGMQPWSALSINFVVAGFAKCGTSTLAATLHKHPQIVMSACEVAEFCENAIWSTNYRLDFLLSSSAVFEVHSSFVDKMKHAPILKGVKDSRVLEEDSSIVKLTAIPGIRVIVVIRDPIEALESHYNAMECWKMRSLHEMAELGLTDCIARRGWGLWSERLEKLQLLLPGGLKSMFVVHLSTISSTNVTKSKTFRKMLRFIGLPMDDVAVENVNPFNLEVRNRVSRRSRLSQPGFIDVCASQNRATLQLLRGRYADEYSRLAAFLEASGAEVPLDFAHRRMRCDTVALPIQSTTVCTGQCATSLNSTLSGEENVSMS